MNTNEDSKNERKMALEKVISKNKSVKSESVLKCLEFITADIHFGKTWPTAELAAQMNMAADSIQFGMAISEVNKCLERRGYHLSSRGKNGQSYFVESLDRSGSITAAMNRDALNTLKRAVVFAHGVVQNHGDKLSESQRRRLEKQAEISAMRYVIASRIR
jgi:hypothetical protein